MMELTCAFVLIFVNLVTATPYGYGVKGGAAAKADASAVAGAYSGLSELPLHIPAGSGLSGSFSKSSSSSHSSASSSASSSSSSFSFSGTGSGAFTGSGANGGVLLGQGGCSSGACQNGGANDITGQNGANAKGNSLAYSGANAAATAVAGSLGSAHSKNGGPASCTGSECSHKAGDDSSIYNDVSSGASGPISSSPYDGSDSKCTSGKCIPSSQTGTYGSDVGAVSQSGVTSPQYGSDRKCISGQCGPTKTEGNPSTSYGPGSGHVSIPHLSTPVVNSGSEDHSTNYQSDNKCISGNCGSTTQPETSSTSYRPESSYVPLQQPGYPSSNDDTNKKCSSGHCSHNSLSGYPSTDYDLNVSQPETPSIELGKCTSGHCGATTSSIGSENEHGPVQQPGNPVSYSPVSSHTLKPGIPNYVPNNKCTNGQCGPNSQPETPSTNYGSNYGSVPQAGSPSTNYGPHNKCSSGNCHLNPQSGEHTTNYGSNDIPVITSGASTSKYDSKDHSSHYDKTSTGYANSGPSCAFGNCESSLTPSSKPTYTHTPNSYQSPGTLVQSPPKCNSPNCDNYQYSAAAGAGSYIAPGYSKPATYLTTPKQGTSYSSTNNGLPSIDAGHQPSNYNIPSQGYYTNNESKKPSCTTGNCNVHQSTGAYTPTYSTSVLPNFMNVHNAGIKCTSPTCTPNTYNNGYSKVPSTSGVPTSTTGSGCAKGNCVTHPSTNYNIGVGNIPESNIPNYSEGQPSYSPAPSGSGSPTIPSNVFGTVSKHPGFVHPGTPSHGMPSAGPFLTSPGHTVAHSQFGVQGSVKPTGEIGYNKENLPVYTGGFGGPAGLLKPNDYNLPASTSVSPFNNNKPTVPAGSQNPIICSSGNCGPPSHIPSPTKPFSTSTDHTSNNIGTSTGTNLQSGIEGTVKPIGGVTSDKENLPVYTGGFGGPSGLLKPNDYSTSATSGVTSSNDQKPTVPSGSHNPAVCSSGNCATLPGTSSTGAPSSTLIHGGPANGAQATAGASASAVGVAYTGGFGGPPGFLKPYDNGKSETTGVGGKFIGSQLGSHYSSAPVGVPGSIIGQGIKDQGKDIHGYNIGIHSGTGTQAGAFAHASAVAGASSGAIGAGNLHEAHNDHSHEQNKATSGCGGGCGSSDGGPYGRGSNFHLAGGLGHSKGGAIDGLNGGLNTAGSSAKSLAGALSGASAFGVGGSFATSSASAHASAGAGTKGGYYGRR